MRIVVIGIGKVGSTVAEYLSKEDHEVIIVDQDPTVVERMVNRYDVLGVCGNGAFLDVQKEAGISKADLVVAMTSSDEFNILCCVIAKRNGAKHAIARVRNPDYFSQMVFLQGQLGLSMAVNPEMEAANAISRMLRFPSATKLEVFAKGRLEMAELTLPEGTPLDGLALSRLGGRFGVQVLICAVQRGNDVIIPTGNFVLRAGDRINVTASHADMGGFFKKIGMEQYAVRSVMIIGGGRIAYYLAKQLLPLGIRVKIVEHNEDTCEQLSNDLPKATVLCGDGTDQELLQEERIEASDACVALTGVDEENIIVSLYARTQNVKKVITKVNRTNLLGIMRSMGVESVVSPRMATGSRVLQYARSISTNRGSSVKTLYRLLDGRMEALEFEVAQNAPFAGKTLQQLQFKKGVLIAGIMRAGKVIHPQGSDCMLPGDLVAVVTTLPGVKDIEDTLEG